MDHKEISGDSQLACEEGVLPLSWRGESTEQEESAAPSHDAAPVADSEDGKLTAGETNHMIWRSVLSKFHQSTTEENSRMTITRFVEQKFVPEHVAAKRLSGRTHFQAILKHILRPEEVDRIFGVSTSAGPRKLAALPGWPYLDGMRLCDVRPEDVNALVAAAVERGYSTQTVKHIRNVVSAIFTHARQERWYGGENPAFAVKLPGMVRKEAHVLTYAQTATLVRAMRSPELEMTLFLLFTGMSMVEICGLQWKRVNLGPEAVSGSEGLVPPCSIAIRKEWYRGQLNDVKPGRERDVAISAGMAELLGRLAMRARHTGSEDYVLISRVGRPISQTNIMARRLKPIGERLEMPWISWQVLRRTHKALLREFKEEFHERIWELARLRLQRYSEGSPLRNAAD